MRQTELFRSVLALALCAVMVLGTLPGAAMAGEVTEPTETTTEPVETVAATEPVRETEAVTEGETTGETVPETAPQTLPETAPQTLTEPAGETVAETLPENVETEWVYESETKTLTILADLPDAVYDPSADIYATAWDGWILELRRVVVAQGVTRLGAGLFAEAVALEEVSLPESLQSIGACAFRSCICLKDIEIPAHTAVAEDAFAYSALDTRAVSLSLAKEPGLETLTIRDGEGNAIALNRPFRGDVTAYAAIDPIEEETTLTVIATAEGGDLTIGETPAESGAEVSVTPVWEDGRTFPLTISLTQGEGTTTYSISFLSGQAQITGIAVATPPTKTVYSAGETFDPTGLTATVTYAGGETGTVSGALLQWEPDGSLTPDITAITLTYGGQTTQQSITVLPDLMGSGTEEKPYLLQCEEDIRTLDAWVAAGDARAAGYFRMEEDIAITGTWEGIGDSTHPFTGDFDGGSNQISIPEGGKALFAKTRGAVIHDLKVYGPKIADYGLVSTYSVDKKATYYAQFLRVTLVEGTKTLKSGFIGGYASGEDQVLIDDCHVEAGVVIGYDKDQSHIGSFGGEYNGTIQNSTSAATVYGTSWVGGLVGNKGQSMADLNMLDCTFTGTVVATGNYVGGIVGGGYAGTVWGMVSAPNARGVTIKNCTCSGSVTGGNGVGGILGAEACVQQFWNNGPCNILNNRFTGTVKATGGTYVGGIIGFLQSLNVYGNISGNCYKTGDRGIGAVAHVDTSGVTGGFHDGTFYYNTSVDGLETINCVALETYMELSTIGKASTGNNRAVTKTKLNRSDDPLGADKDKLCYTDEKIAKYVTEVTATGTWKTQYTQGEALDLTGIVLTAKWSDNTTTSLTLSDVTVSGYDKNQTGDQTVFLTYQGVKAEISVKVLPKSSKITVSVSIQGCSNHGDNGKVHGLGRGGMTVWASDSALEAESSETVWDVIQRLAENKGVSIQASYSSKYDSYYIEAVGGLAEFDNGPNSGWMYTVNGSHPEVGVSARYVKQGDKIVLHYTDDYNYEEGGIYYGQALRDGAYVDSLIAAIGTVTFTDACKKKIDDARAAYEALSPGMKKQVTKLSQLEKTEADYKALSQTGDVSAAKAVINLISSLGTITADSGDAIAAAQKAYDALTPAQKKLVTNYADLEKATTAWNQAVAQKVIDLIGKLPATITISSKSAIDAARTAYDALTDAQKKLVTNYKTLTQAETAYAKLTATTQDKSDAKKVSDQIAALGTITVDSREAVEQARAAYDALTQLQKQLVENYDDLEAAEEKLALLSSLGKVANAYIDTGNYMEALGAPSVGTVGGEWMVIGLARSGRDVPGAEDYYAGVESYVQENADENGRLHKAKSTNNSRIILALTALGKDVSNVAGHDLLQGLSDLDFVKKQGNNGPIWALIALDSGNYSAAGGTATRQALLEEILRVQTSDGGWAISGDEADSDMTGMALQALAPYYPKDTAVQQAVDRAIDRLSQMQDADGGYSTFSGNGKVATSESVSQVIVALTALGIDPDTDPRFVKSGGSALDALLSYAVTGGGFRHIATGELDGMATEQGYYALTAYVRFLDKKTALYDMTDVIDQGGDPEAAPATPETTLPAETPEETGKAQSFPVLWVVLALAFGIGIGMGCTLVGVLVVLKLKKKEG